MCICYHRCPIWGVCLSVDENSIPVSAVPGMYIVFLAVRSGYVGVYMISYVSRCRWQAYLFLAVRRR